MVKSWWWIFFERQKRKVSVCDDHDVGRDDGRGAGGDEMVYKDSVSDLEVLLDNYRCVERRLRTKGDVRRQVRSNGLNVISGNEACVNVVDRAQEPMGIARLKS